METITIPKEEYEKMLKEINLLKDQKLLEKVNDLIEILYQEKHNLILTDFTDDLTEYSINNFKEWNKESEWDKL